MTSESTPGQPQLEEFFVSSDETETVSYLVERDSGAELDLDVAELLSFWIGDEEFAVDILEIQEILKMPSITLVPRVPPVVIGITSLRGIIVPVVDMRRFLGVEPRPVARESRVLVLKAQGDPVGLLVDRVVNVSRLARESIEPIPKTMQRGASEAVDGMARIDDRFLIVLNLEAVFGFLERHV